jgi:hypothetical protein
MQGAVLFKSSTAWAHRAINAVVLVQTGTLTALVPITQAMPLWSAALVAGSAASLFALMRRYERCVVLSLTLSGNAKSVEIETTKWYGGIKRTVLPVEAFVSSNSTWPVEDKSWWLACLVVDPANERPWRLLFESFAGNVTNHDLFNRLITGKLKRRV